MKKTLLILSVLLSAISCVDSTIDSENPANISSVELNEEENVESQVSLALGFNEYAPSEDSQVIYVSSSDGDDANDCLSSSSPCESIDAGIEKMREDYPDHLLLKRGDTWRFTGSRGLDDLTSGRSATEPAVISYYGESGPRPIIEGDAQVYRQDKKPVKHLRFVGLHFYGYKKDPKNEGESYYDISAGSPSLNFIGDFEDIQLEDNKFEFSRISIQQYLGNRPTDFVIYRNLFAGTYAYGSSTGTDTRATSLYAYGVDGLNIEENVFDYGGWYPGIPDAGANAYSHNIYLQYDSDGDRTFFRNNICVRGASHGIQMRSGGLAEDNFLGRNTIGLLMGYSYGGREVPTGTTAQVLNNVVSEGLSMYKGEDACTGDSYCTTALWGIDMTVNSDADYQAHGNIVSKLSPDNVTPDGRTLVKRGMKETFDNGRDSYPNTNNISYRWNTDDQGVSDGYADPERTLGTYNTSIGGDGTFDGFMNTVLARGVGEWDVTYEAISINAYIRAGYSLGSLGTDDH